MQKKISPRHISHGFIKIVYKNQRDQIIICPTLLIISRPLRFVFKGTRPHGRHVITVFVFFSSKRSDYRWWTAIITQMLLVSPTNSVTISAEETCLKAHADKFFDEIVFGTMFRQKVNIFIIATTIRVYPCSLW